MTMWIYDETCSQLPTNFHITDPDLMHMVNHIVSNWGLRSTITGHAYGTAALFRENDFVDHITGELYYRLAQKARGRMVLEYSIKWFYSTVHHFLLPASIEPDLDEFLEVTGDVRAFAHSVHLLATFAVQIRAVTILAVPQRRPTGTRSHVFNDMMQAAALGFNGMAQAAARQTDRIQGLFDTTGEIHSLTAVPESGASVTPEQIRSRLMEVDNQPLPTIADEPMESEHGAMRHRPSDGAYPLDFSAMIAGIDELIGDDYDE